MPLRTRYALTILLVIVITVTAVASATLVRVRSVLDEAQRQSTQEMNAALEQQLHEFGLATAEQLASAMVEPLYHFELDNILSLLRPVLAQDAVILTEVFDPSGLVIHDGTDTIEAYGQDVSDHGIVAEAMRNGKSVSRLQGDLLDVAAPIVVGKRVLGGVHLHVSARTLQFRSTTLTQTLQAIHDDGIADFIKLTVFLLVSLSLAGIVIAYILARGMAQPIAALSALARRIGRGDYSAAVEIKRKDEIGDLARAFHSMAHDLQVAHDELAGAKEEADRANAMKSQFLANMSHEIRTPMNGVLGMTDLLMRTELTRRQTRFIKAVQQSAEGLLAIINDILDFARIEAGKVALNPSTDFDLHELVADVVDLAAETSQAKGLHIAGMLAEDVPHYVKGDPNRLRQVLMNLVGNAIKFTEEGEVVVRVSGDPGGLADRLRFEVIDTGIGIEPAAQSRLFAAFEQADGSITRRFGGTGLGLAISAQLIDLMGGEIGVTSAPGEGSTFWFTARLPEIEASEAGFAVTRSLDGMRILIVDNNVTSTNIISSAILGWNGHPETARDGPSALHRLTVAAAKGSPFDLAIVEIALPGINAVQLAQRIHARPALADLPIIVMTSFDWHGDGAKAEKAGIQGVLTKPIRQTELFDEIANVLGKKMLIVSAPDEPETPDTTGTESDQLGLRVLLAEDNPVNQEVAKEFLSELSCDVETVDNGKQALEAFERGGFDAILMDCQMPEMDGLQAARHIRERERELDADRRIPIIAVTANAYDSDRRLCLDAGMTDYLAKPFTQEGLKDALERAFDVNHDTESQTGVEDKTMHDANDNAPASGTLDRAALEALAAVTPNDPGSLVKKVIDLYLEHAPGLVDNIRQALDSGDCDAARSAAHSLKSSSANVGAVNLSAQCKDLEDAAREGNVNAPEAVAAAIDEEFAAVCRALQSELTERTKGAA